ncbi:MAG: ankyrin repeat domain-containing protein [Chthoniobacter sp.]
MTPLMVAIITQQKNASRTGPGSVTTTDPKTHVEEHYSSHGEFVKELLERGADLTLRNKAGQTALDLARENGNEEILSLLQAAGKPAAKP